MSALKIKTAEIFEPLLQPNRYKGAWGGRGSGKSHFFAELLVEECMRVPGTRAVCIREHQRSLRESSKHLIQTKIADLGVGHLFTIWQDRIETPGGGTIIFTGMKDHNAESIKSLEGCRIAWVEEAQTLSARSLDMLDATIRAKDSELWFSWNPTRKADAIDELLKSDKPPPRSCVVKANYQHNPWFLQTELEETRQFDHERYPERYAHKWLGDYAGAFEGAYYAGVLNVAKEEGRIDFVNRDPNLPIKAYFDIGGSGASADAFVAWIVQFAGDMVKVLDYYEVQGQVLATHLNWMRKSGYEDAICYLPHDGINENNVTGKRYKDHWTDAGFKVEVIPNQGRGAAQMRIEATRRIMHKCWFHEQKTQSGREALGYYHEKRDETRNVGLGPLHDWSSHAADAFGMMAISYESPAKTGNFNRTINYPKTGIA